MNLSVWISLSALVVSILSLIYSIRNGLVKEHNSLLEKRNLLRVNVHETTMEVLILIESIRNQASSEQELQIVADLVETARGMTSLYKDLKLKIEIPFPHSPSNFIKEYDHFLSDMKEFNLILSLAKTELEKGNMDDLERTVGGLRVRMLGSNNNNENYSQ